MVKFVEVNPDEISFQRAGRRGKVCYPIIKAFQESGMFCVKLDREGMKRSTQSLYAGLRQYIMTHQLPVKVFQADNEIHLMRLDRDKDGNPIPDWKEENYGGEDDNGDDEMEVTEITPISKEQVRGQ